MLGVVGNSEHGFALRSGNLPHEVADQPVAADQQKVSQRQRQRQAGQAVAGFCHQLAAPGIGLKHHGCRFFTTVLRRQTLYRLLHLFRRTGDFVQLPHNLTIAHQQARQTLRGALSPFQRRCGYRNPQTDNTRQHHKHQYKRAHHPRNMPFQSGFFHQGRQQQAGEHGENDRQDNLVRQVQGVQNPQREQAVNGSRQLGKR